MIKLNFNVKLIINFKNNSQESQMHQKGRGLQFLGPSMQSNWIIKLAVILKQSIIIIRSSSFAILNGHG